MLAGHRAVRQRLGEAFAHDLGGDVLVGAASAALQIDAVDVGVRVFAGQRSAPPLVGRFERLVVARLETVPAETPAPHRISLTSSTRRVDTPAKHISMMASSIVFPTSSRNSLFTAGSSNDALICSAWISWSWLVS